MLFLSLPKPLKLNCPLSVVPQILLWLLALLTITMLIALQLPLIILIFLILVTILLCFWQLQLLRVDAQKTLLFDGDNWFVSTEGSENQLLNAKPKMLFNNEYLLVVSFKMRADKRRRKIYLAMDNCTQAEFRAVCRLL